jgi:hypothetical protein
MSWLKPVAGINSEERVGYKSPIVMGAIGLIVLYFFGLVGRSGQTTFELTRKEDAIQLPAFEIASAQLGIISGVLMLVIAAAALLLSLRNQKTPIWLASNYG